MTLRNKHILSLVIAAAWCQAALAQPTALVADRTTDARQVEQVPASATRPGDDPGVAASGGEPRILRGNDQVIAPPKALPSLTGAPISFSFEEAPIAEVVRTILGDLLKVEYLLYPPLNGAVTLVTRAPVAPDQAVFLLESALSVNGLAMVRDARGSYHVGRVEALKGVSSGLRQTSTTAMPPGMGPVIVPLQYIGAGEMAAILRPMMPADSLLRVDTVRNLLILAGTRSQAEGWLDIVKTFDVDLLQGMSVGVFPLKHASVTEVEAALRLLSGAGAASAGGSPAARPGGGASAAAARPAAGGTAGATQSPAAVLSENNPLFGALRVLPIERINSILIVTPRAAYLDEARRWIERFDRPSDGGTEPQLYIYQVQNGNARHLAGVLQGIFGGGAAAGGGANSGVAPGLITATGTTGGYPVGNAGLGALGFGGSAQQSLFANRGTGVQSGLQQGLSSSTSLLGGGRTQQNLSVQQPVSAAIGNVRVMSDDLNNSVLIWGTKAEYEKIEATLKRLDLPPTQVLIEASIVEVTLNDNLRYGLQWAFSDSRSSGYRGEGFLSNSTTSGVFAAPTTGFSYTLRNPAGTVRAILSALSAKTSVRVVASPSLMVLDNHQAAIVVGTQTPILSGTTSNLEGTVTTTNIQYKDTGVNLMVTPSVNAGNLVTMQVDQSVTDVGAADEVTKQRSFLQRQLSSKVAVRSGESIVMGGLIQERGNTTKSGVPVLHTLPVIGNLFGTTGDESVRTELLVVITPRVVRTDIDIREVSEELRDGMKGLRALMPTSTTEPSAATIVQPAAAP